MQSIDSGLCRTSGGAAGQASATQCFRRFHRSFADRTDRSTIDSSATTTGSGPGSSSADSVTSVSGFVAREVRKERGVIDLVTAEGDRVSIRFRAKEVVTGSAMQATASDGTTAIAASTSVFSRVGVKIEVDGDLNEDELQAIGDLLGKVEDVATRFFSGDVQEAFSAASSLGVDSDQIAGYRLSLTYSRKVSAAYAYAGRSLPASSQYPASTGDGGATPAGSAAAAGGVSSVPASSTSSGASTANSSADMTSTTSGSTAGSAVGAPSADAPLSSASEAASPAIDTAASAVDPETSTTDAAVGSAGSGGAVDGGADGPAATAATDSAATATADSAATATADSAATATADSAATATADSAATDTADSAGAPAVSAAPISARQTIADFINDALSKLGTANGVGRLTFSMHWKLSVLATAIESAQPALPTTAADQAAAANTQLLGDSLQKIAAA